MYKLFAATYKELYTSVSYDNSEMGLLIDTNFQNVLDCGFSEDCIINVDDVRGAIGKLKLYKSVGDFELSTDHFVHANDDLAIHIALLLSAVVVHGFSPQRLVNSTIIPIPKGRNVNSTDSGNYRGIALSSIFVKLFDYIVLERYRDKLITSDLQFGFKLKSSTNMCSMVLKETLLYYVAHNSTVYCTFLDAKKAFDRIQYCKLFRLLMERGLLSCITRVIIGLYLNNFVRVAWNGVMSEYFLAVNGVKQGGVLSPVIFSVYIDGLLVRLRSSGVGCYIGMQFVGALAYADDLTLLAPSPTAMRKLLRSCDLYADEYSIVFNASTGKSKCLVVRPANRKFYGCDDEESFTIGGSSVEFVTSFVHLGHVISAKMDDELDVKDACCKFIGQTNHVLCFFSSLNSVLKHRLFRAYCSDIYGCELWRIDDSTVDSFCVKWRNGLRRVWNLPYRTHGDILHMLADDLPVFDTICKRIVKFVVCCLMHCNALVNFIARQSVLFECGRSLLGRNLQFCSDRYRFKLCDVFGHSFNINGIVRKYCEEVCNESRLAAAQFLLDLIDTRDNFRHSDSLLTFNEISDIIVHLATQ